MYQVKLIVVGMILMMFMAMMPASIVEVSSAVPEFNTMMGCCTKTCMVILAIFTALFVAILILVMLRGLISFHELPVVSVTSGVMIGFLCMSGNYECKGN